MNKRSRLLYVWAAVSAVLLIAGIVLLAVLGFNNALDKPVSKTVDIRYNVLLEISEENKQALADASEAAFAANGISYEEKTALEGQADPNSSTQGSFFATGNDFTLRYTFGAGVSDEALQTSADAIRTALSGEAFSGAALTVTVHTLKAQSFGDAAWRAAIAIAVGAVVALIYVAVRFGVGCALTGLAAAVNDAVLTLAFFAITRIPVYAFAPWLYAAVAAAASLGLWLVRCMKLRENAKDPAFSALSAEDAVGEACRATDRTVLILAGCLLAVFALCAAFMASGGGAAVFAGALVPAAASLYSGMLLAPALHVRVKGAFDRFKAKHVRHTGKKRVAREE